MIWGLLAGCRSVDPAPAAAVPMVPARSVAGASADSQPTLAVKVMVDRGDGMVVVNRRPLGLAPQTVELAVTSMGYLKEPVAITVRFVAADVSEASFTIEEVLEVTDRPPSRLVFTRDGVQRVFDARP